MRRLLRKIGHLVTGKAEAAAPDGVLGRFKAHVLGDDVPASNVLAPDDAAIQQYEEAGALSPPLPFDSLVLLYLTANSLRQNVDAMATNVDGFGWRPVLTLQGLFGERAVDAVRELHAAKGTELTEDQAKATVEEWRREAIRERHRMTHFFESLNPEETFTAMRKKTRQDLEVLGNGAWEWRRNKIGALALAVHVPFVTVRLLPLDEKAIDVEVPMKVDPVTIATVTIRKRFRRYIQIQEQLVVYFKEFGDPRTISSKTGAVYENAVAMDEAEPGVRPATEIYHYKIDSPNEVYGMPRWSGTMPEVIGSRLAAEVNVLYFENKSVPPLMMIVSGGRVAADSVDRIRDFIKNNIKGGAENFHNILIIEAESEGDAKAAGQCKIDVKPLTEAINQDALFQKYDRNNIDKVGATWRIPGMYRGESKELNRASAEVAKPLVEEQVFQPEREAFDAIMNRLILPRLGIRFWEFRTRAPITRDPQVLATILAKLVENAVILPGEAREMVPDILGRDLDRCDEDFMKRPIRVTLAMLRSGAMEAAGSANGATPAGAPHAAPPAPAAPPATDGAQPPAEPPSDAGMVKRLLPMARDVAVVQRLVEAIETHADLAGLTDGDLQKMIAADGCADEGTDGRRGR